MCIFFIYFKDIIRYICIFFVCQVVFFLAGFGFFFFGGGKLLGDFFEGFIWFYSAFLGLFLVFPFLAIPNRHFQLFSSTVVFLRSFLFFFVP